MRTACLLPMRRPGLAAAVLAAALLAPGCASLAPQDDDTTLESIAKGIVLVPALLATVVADAVVEDETGVSPLGLDDAGDGDTDAWGEEVRRANERELTRRDLDPFRH